MLNSDVPRTKNHSDHVESKVVTRTLKARHPDFRRPAELSLLTPAHLRDGTSESLRGSGLYLNKCDCSLSATWTNPCRHQIDVAMPVLEAAIRDFPAVNCEPFLGNAFTLQPECLLCY